MAYSKKMRTKNRNLILDYLEKKLTSKNQGATTLDISNALMMQRTNVSKILNELISENLVEKDSAKYPVVYRRTQINLKSKESLTFDTLIGHNDSLKRAIHLAKSAILYPKKSLNILLLAKQGTGKSSFVRKIFEFAVESGVCDIDTPFVRMNCSYYKENVTELNIKFKECLRNSEGGFLFIDNFQFLDTESKVQLSSILENSDNNSKLSKQIVICAMPPLMSSVNNFDNITSKISIIISLPDLKDRGLQERFDFIKKFFCNEASESNSTIRVNSEVLIALLLYPCDNIKQIFHDIRQACASAYSRELDNNKANINVLIGDFSHNVRSGLLNYKNTRVEVDTIIKEESKYEFNAFDLSILNNKYKEKQSIYDWINTKKNELNKRGFSPAEINTIVNVGIETEFNKYRQNLFNTVINKEQLSQLVDSKIIELVDAFFEKASNLLNRYFAVSVYYGLCLHIQALVERRTMTRPVKIEKMMEFIERNKEEYSLAMNFCDQLTTKYELELPIDEIVIVAMFLCGHNNGYEQNNHPSLLVAMHGLGVAKALADTIKVFNDVTVYSYDLSLNMKPLDAYEDIKQTILNIPHEKGIFIVYDMGSLKDIFNMIGIETGIKIKMIEMPVTLILMDLCRKLMLSSDVSEAFDSLTQQSQLLDIAHDYESSKKSKAIVSFCMTGEGGAIQIKKYIESNFKLDGVEVIPVQLADQGSFLQELNKISKEKDIICIVGTFNPNVYGIPFIPIENIFNTKNHDLNNFLNTESLNKQEFLNNSETIFEHLSKELKNIDTCKVKEKVVNFILNVEGDLNKAIDMNEKIGLLVHITCTIDRLKGGYVSQENSNKETVIKNNMTLYRIITKRMIDLEKELNININDDEICNIIYIIKKSRI